MPTKQYAKKINGYYVKDEEARAAAGAAADRLDEIDNSYIIEEITVTKYREDASKTDYWITHIPHEDAEGNLIKLQHGTANDVSDYSEVSLENVRSFAQRHNATIAINASIFGIKAEYPVNYNLPVGPIIVDGDLVSNLGKDGYITQSISVLGVKEDNTLVFYDWGVTPQQLIADGVVNSFCAFDHVLTNGEVTFGPSTSDIRDPWNLIGQNSQTKDIYILNCNGRGYYEQKGLLLTTAIQKLVECGCDDVYRLDSGGSNTLVRNGIVYNTPTDGAQQNLRDVPDFIYFAKDVNTRVDRDIADVYKELGDTRREVDKLKEKLKYLDLIHNSALTFEYPNLRRENTDLEEALRLRLKRGMDTDSPYLDSQIVLSSDDDQGKRAVLSVYDNVNNKTVTRIDGGNETIELNGSPLATIFRTAKNTTDLNAVLNTCIVRAPGNIANIPEQNVGWTVVVISAVSPGNVHQIALPEKTNSTEKPIYIRAYNPGNQTWESWKILAQATNPEA